MKTMTKSKGVGRGVGGGAPKQIEPVSLQSARKLMLALILLEEELADAIKLAYAAGNSATQIELALGINKGTVKKIAEGMCVRFDSLNGTWGDRRRGTWSDRRREALREEILEAERICAEDDARAATNGKNWSP